MEGSSGGGMGQGTTLKERREEGNVGGWEGEYR